jgi:hypothetical protein
MEDFPPFPVEYLDLPDDELGELLLGWFVVHFAESRGLFPDIPSEFSGAVLSQLKFTNARPENAAVEKALHKAADGDFETAGKTIRYYYENGAHHMAAVRIAHEEREKRLKGPRKGGAARKALAASENLERDKKILEQYYQLIGSGRNPREGPAILARRFELSPARIRQILKEKRKPA